MGRPTGGWPTPTSERDERARRKVSVSVSKGLLHTVDRCFCLCVWRGGGVVLSDLCCFLCAKNTEKTQNADRTPNGMCVGIANTLVVTPLFFTVRLVQDFSGFNVSCVRFDTLTLPRAVQGLLLSLIPYLPTLRSSKFCFSIVLVDAGPVHRSSTVLTYTGATPNLPNQCGCCLVNPCVRRTQDQQVRLFLVPPGRVIILSRRCGMAVAHAVSQLRCCCSPVLALTRSTVLSGPTCTAMVPVTRAQAQAMAAGIGIAATTALPSIATL